MEIHTSPLLTTLSPFLIPDAKPPDGATLAELLIDIAACEVREGGPYRSETGNESSKLDLGFNIAIALFLRTLNVRLPNLDEYIQKRIAKGQPPSLFYAPDEHAVLIVEYQSEKILGKTSEYVSWTDEELAIITEIRSQMDWRLLSSSVTFKRDAISIIERTIMGNPDKQMSLMPLFIRQALGKKGQTFSDHKLAKLGIANVFFWTAFIIYDDFWDEDEAAEPRYLPVANLFARHCTSFFSTHLSSTRFSGYFDRLMDKLDAANSWEITSCRMRREGSVLHIPDELPRYKDFGIKFYPAAGHVLGPVSMLIELGYAEHSPEVEGLMDYFKHYLIAMQLNDDSHDWKEDLERGHISTAIFYLLSAWQEKYPVRKEINLETDMPELEYLFWFEVLPQLCEAIVKRTDKAQRVLDGISCIENPAPLQQFIDRNRRAAEGAMAEQRQSIAFLEAIETAENLQK